MPTRLLRDFTDSFRLERVSAEGERLFVRLIQKADDFGRFHADPRLVRSACFPLVAGVTEKDVSRWLDEIIRAGLLLRYEVQGRPYLAVVEFRQRLRQMEGKFPAPDGQPKEWQALRGGVAVDGQLTVNGPASDGLSRVEEKRVEVEGSTPGKPANSPPARTGKKSERPTLAEVVEFCSGLELPASDGESTFHKWQGNGFTNGGRPVKDWRATLRSWKAVGYLPSQKNTARNGHGAHINGTTASSPKSDPSRAEVAAWLNTRPEYTTKRGEWRAWSDLPAFARDEFWMWRRQQPQSRPAVPNSRA